MSRGGPRQGKAGASYQNRTDLNPTAMPITAVPGQGYGAAGAQKAAQSVAPMANGPIATSNPQASASNTPPPLTGAAPGTMPDLFRPTERPNEHFMTGVNAGPGQGSEALNPILPTTPQASALGLLNSLGDNVSPFVKSIRDNLAAQSQNEMPH